MADGSFQYDGERLIPSDERLKNLLLEDLAKFHFALTYTKDKTVLDAGCGAGQGSTYMARNGAHHVTAVDVSHQAVRFARTYWAPSALSFGCMDVMYLGFPDARFDAVTSIEVIEHLSDPGRYIGEIRRVLRPGGVLVLSTPNKDLSSPTPGSMWPHHVHEFYPEELRDLLSRYFASVEMWGMWIPVYDRHPVRKAVHWLAPLFKPVLPVSLRTRVLPMVRNRIKPDLSLDDFEFTLEDVRGKSTLLAICRI